MSDNDEDIINYAESEAEEGEGVIQSDEENLPQNNENNDNQEEQNKDDEEEKKVVKPKRVVRNPQPKLNAETLKGPRGLKSLENYFKNTKYKGNGHEVEDLQVILKTYEHWCHRLFPKFPFDDCIKKLETLGHKKPVITYLKKIRLGMEDTEENIDIEQDDQDTDDILRDTVPVTSINDDEFDKLLPKRKEPSQPITQTQEEEDIQLTDDQLERIRINRELALERRRLKMQQGVENEKESEIVLQESSENVNKINEISTENESVRVEHMDTTNVEESARNLNENVDLVLVDNENTSLVLTSPINISSNLNKTPQDNRNKNIISNSSSMEAANETELEEMSQGSNEEIEQSSYGVANFSQSNLLKQNENSVNSNSNSHINEMDYDS